MNQVSSFKRSVKSGDLDLDGLKLSELKEHYSKLQGNFTKLHEKYLELEGAHTELNKRLRATTKGYNQWKDHANQVAELSKKRSQTIKKLKAKLAAAAAVASGPLDASFSSDAPIRPASRQHMVTPEPIELNIPNELGPARRDPILARSPSAWRPLDFGAPDHRSTTSTASSGPTTTYKGTRISQRWDIPPDLETYVSTQDAEEVSTLPPLPQTRDLDTEVVRIKDEPSSDTPVVVSERCLRKRKCDDNQTNVPQTSVVKREDGSEPLITTERRHFVPHESIDFDAEGGTVCTPRKRYRPNPQPNDRFISDSIRAPQLQTSDTRPAGRIRPTTQLRLDENLENSEESHLLERDTEPSEQQVNRPSALKTLEYNAVPQQIPKTTRDRGSSSHWHGLHNVAEDGGQHRVSRPSTGGGTRTGRLRTLLNTPSPAQEATPPTLRAQSDDTSALRPSGNLAQRKRQLFPGKNGTKNPSETPQSDVTQRGLSKTRTAGNNSINQRSDERAANSIIHGARPLRERPKSELCITDFKVNPAVNEGYDYAFTEVVRNKDDRATLTGCVEEDCCGPMFRLQARAMRGQTGPSDFQALLEKYMGDEAWKLSTMSKPEKEDLWVDAKMRELANEIGKHRHRYHRAASPAGFWRMDFPSTQEEERDKEEAARMVRKMVDERYREAMRPGGRWLFRDE